MANTILAQTPAVHNTQTKTNHFVVLDNGNLHPVPEGADADFVRKVENRKLKSAPKPKRKYRTRQSTRRFAKCNLPESILFTRNTELGVI